MARKKIETGSAEERQKAELSGRVWQIRQILFDDNNRTYSKKICVNEQSLSQICSGKRNAGIEIVQRILENIPSISPDWLLLGKGEMLRKDAQPEPQRNIIDMVSLEKYEKKVEECALLKAELAAMKEYAASYAKEKTAYSGITSPAEV